jgi:hypothetical protein
MPEVETATTDLQPLFDQITQESAMILCGQPKLLTIIAPYGASPSVTNPISPTMRDRW